MDFRLGIINLIYWKMFSSHIDTHFSPDNEEPKREEKNLFQYLSYIFILIQGKTLKRLN